MYAYRNYGFIPMRRGGQSRGLGWLGPVLAALLLTLLAALPASADVTPASRYIAPQITVNDVVLPESRVVVLIQSGNGWVPFTARVQDLSQRFVLPDADGGMRFYLPDADGGMRFYLPDADGGMRFYLPDADGGQRFVLPDADGSGFRR